MTFLQLPSLSGAFARLCLHLTFLQHVSIPTVFSMLPSLTGSHCSRKPRKKLVPVNEQSYGRGCTLASQILDIFGCVQLSPPHHRPAKGTGSSCVTAELMQIHEYLCTFNISAHLCFFKDIGRCINAAGGGGTMNDRRRGGEGVPAFAIHQPWGLHKLRASCTCRQGVL